MSDNSVELTDEERAALTAARELLLAQARRDRATDDAAFYPPTADELIATADHLDARAWRSRESTKHLPPDHPFVAPALDRARTWERVAGWMRLKATE